MIKHFQASVRFTTLRKIFGCLSFTFLMTGLQTMWSNSGKLAKSEASYVLAAIQFYRPQAKNNLPWSWKLVRTWNQIELPTRATPFSAEVLLGMADKPSNGSNFVWAGF